MSIFTSVQIKKPPRTAFDLSHEVKMSMKMGKLVPFLCQEVVPGDTFRMNAEVMMRFAPMISPVMHRINVYTHFFFVPNRLIWKDWEEFITGGEDGQAEPVVPYFNFSGSDPNSMLFNVGSLCDYLGLPVEVRVNDPIRVSALPFRAYQMIYNEYYRDQNLHEPVPFSLESGEVSFDDLENIVQLRNRCWEKDYFTSALPWPQRGGDVHLPLAGDAPVFLDDVAGYQVVKKGIDHMPQLNANLGSNNLGYLTDKDDVETSVSGVVLDPNGTMKADMSNVTSTTINELRRASRLQLWLERNARAGSRYVEQILSHFGVKSSDARLQRPEFLGGGKNPVVVSEVLQTSSTNEISPQANMSGHGISVGNTNRFKRFFEEHGFVIGIISVLPRTCYQQGIPRQYLKFDKFDHYFPTFANLGEQPVYNAELYAGNNPLGTFGYQSRYSEYKYLPSRVAGDFRTNLNFWHMGRFFDNQPVLNEDFVTSDPTKRIFAVTDDDSDELFVQIYNNLKAMRPMPKFGTPML